MDATNVNGQTALQLASDEDKDNKVGELKKKRVPRKKVKQVTRKVEMEIEKAERDRIHEDIDLARASGHSADEEEEGIPNAIVYLLIPVLMAVTLFTVRWGRRHGVVVYSTSN